MRNLTLASGVWSYKIGSFSCSRGMKNNVLFAWTGKVPTSKQLQPAVLLIKEEFGFNFTFPEYPPSPEDLAIAKRFGQEFEGSGATFEGSEEDIKKVLVFLDLLGFGCRVRIEPCTYDGYLKPGYYLYSERGSVDCGLKDAEAQIKRVLNLLPIRDQKVLLTSLLQASKSTKG